MIYSFLKESISQPEIADATRLILPKLISPHSTKQARTVKELADGTRLSPRQVQGVMFRLGDSDRTIVRPLDSESETWEISHDFLVPTIDSILRHWRSPLFTAVRPWFPAATATLILGVASIAPRFSQGPFPSLVSRGWVIQPNIEDNTVRSYYLTCSNCSGQVIRESAYDINRIPAPLDITLNNSAFDARDFAHWADLTNVKTLTVVAQRTITSLSAARVLHQLTSFSVAGASKITDSDLVGLPSSLESLDLSGTAITDSTIVELPRGLRELTLTDTKITDAAIGDLPPGLTRLILIRTRVTDAGLRELPAGLNTLSLDETQITDAGLMHLPKGLLQLTLSETKITGSSFSHLPDSIESLITSKDSCLRRLHFKRLPNEAPALFRRRTNNGHHSGRSEEPASQYQHENRVQTPKVGSECYGPIACPILKSFGN